MNKKVSVVMGVLAGGVVACSLPYGLHLLGQLAITLGLGQ